MIAMILLVRRAQQARKRARTLFALGLLLKFRMYLKERNFLRSSALLSTVRKSPWYTLYALGRDSDFIATVSLTRASFELLLSRFKLFYKFNSGPNKRGRPSRVRDHHCVLSLLLHSYCSPADRKTWCELFGVAPSTLSRTLIKAEMALLETLNASKEADISWPSKEDQVRMASMVERKVRENDSILRVTVTLFMLELQLR